MNIKVFEILIFPFFSMLDEQFLLRGNIHRSLWAKRCETCWAPT